MTFEGDEVQSMEDVMVKAILVSKQIPVHKVELSPEVIVIELMLKDAAV